MTRYTYPAIITYYPAGPDVYTVTFPDLPGMQGCDDNLSGVIELMNDLLFMDIEARIGLGEDIPDPTPFQQHLQQDSTCVSWWTLSHCDVDIESIMERKLYISEKVAEVVEINENFERIMEGLHEVAESAFHANRPMTSGLMTPVGEPVDHDAYDECLADSKGDDQ